MNTETKMQTSTPTQALAEPTPVSYTSVMECQGTQAASSYEATLKAADLDWEVKEDNVIGQSSGVHVPRKKMLFRSDTNVFLGVVGKDYAPTSPREFLKTQFEFAEFSRGKVVRAGFLGERSRGFAFVDLNKEIQMPKAHRAVGDVVRVSIYSSDGWDGMSPRTSRLFLERLVCMNGMVSRQLQSDLWVSHSKNSQTRYDIQWKSFMGEIDKTVLCLTDQFKKLAEARMDATQAKEFLAKLLPQETKIAENNRTKLFDLYQNGKGNNGTTRWDAYNAVTEFVTHHRAYRTTDATSETTNRFLGVLETDLLRARAYEILISN